MGNWSNDLYPFMLRFSRNMSNKLERYIFLKDENLENNTSNI